MEIKDILELARLGYSADDIKELCALKTADPKEADNSNDLKPGDSNSTSGNDQPKEEAEDPIDAIIKREKGEK